MINLLTESDFNILIDFRKQFIKDKFIMFLGYGIIKEGIQKQQIYGIKEDGVLVAYVWFRNLIRKQITKIDEICSVKKGGGTVLLNFVETKSSYDYIELNVVDFNINAINFYHKNMFYVVGKKESKITNLVMRKELKTNKLFKNES